MSSTPPLHLSTNGVMRHEKVSFFGFDRSTLGIVSCLKHILLQPIFLNADPSSSPSGATGFDYQGHTAA